MNDLELEEQRMLASARRVFEPAAEDRQRVLAATLGALHAPPPLPSELPQPGAGPAQVLWHAPGLATRLLVAAALSLGSGAVGYTLAARQPATSTHPPAVEVATRSTPPEPAPAQARTPEEYPERSARGVDDVVAEIRAPRPKHVPAARAKGDDPGARGGAEETATTDEAALRLELDALKRVEAAQRAGRPGEVLSLLSELDRQVPGGSLREERRAAYVIARCALGLGHPGMLARDFGDEFPDSVYEPRVRARCLQEAP